MLPEFFTSGCTYDYRIHDFAEDIDGGPTSRWMSRRSLQHRCWLGASIIERAGIRVYDTFLLTGPSGEMFSYRKRYPFYFERLYFASGQSLGIFDTALGRIGVMLCWDMVFPHLLREMAGRIDMLLIGSAWPDVCRANIPLFGLRGWLGRQPVERPRQIARELGVPVAYCNMTGPFSTRVPFFGVSYRTEYAGNSSITDGEATKVAGNADETLVVADIRVGDRNWHRAA
jgi:predicted amidohydrolase